MKNYHKENCKIKQRRCYKDIYGRTIIVTGRHAFEWTINVHSDTNSLCLLAITFPNRKMCVKELHDKYPKKKKL